MHGYDISSVSYFPTILRINFHGTA
uniref:Uncharacterized protein n=1 Tax=Arundo donax TaxID=35708 RepID=A0A0A8YMN4_ARUDO